MQSDYQAYIRLLIDVFILLGCIIIIVTWHQFLTTAERAMCVHVYFKYQDERKEGS